MPDFKPSEESVDSEEYDPKERRKLRREVGRGDARRRSARERRRKSDDDFVNDDTDDSDSDEPRRKKKRGWSESEASDR